MQSPTVPTWRLVIAGPQVFQQLNQMVPAAPIISVCLSVSLSLCLCLVNIRLLGLVAVLFIQ